MSTHKAKGPRITVDNNGADTFSVSRSHRVAGLDTGYLAGILVDGQIVALEGEPEPARGGGWWPPTGGNQVS